MSVMLETSLGDLIIDLETERCPRTCENFLKLCKMKYYALNAFFNGTSGRLRLVAGSHLRTRKKIGGYEQTHHWGMSWWPSLEQGIDKRRR